MTSTTRPRRFPSRTREEQGTGRIAGAVLAGVAAARPGTPAVRGG